MIEQILQDYAAPYDMNYISLRYFNAAGADRDGEIGEAHDPETHLIPLVLETAAGKRETISIYGHDYDTPDGTCIRDYIHVSDLADAHVRALKYLEKEQGSRIFNLGTGKGFSVKEIIDTTREITGKDIKEIKIDRRSGDPAMLIATAESAEKTLDWKPVQSDIANIIKTAWRWHNQ